MSKLNQIVAVVKDRKQAGQDALTKAYKSVQKHARFEGMVRQYTPLQDGGEQLPDETRPLEDAVPRHIEAIENAFIRMLDTTRLQDEGNMAARASIEVLSETGEVELTIADVPATHLLYLEKVATDICTFVNALPTLDATAIWTPDATADGIYRSLPVSKFRSKKEQRPLVLYQATEHHPAQTQLITEDVNVGTWLESRISGAITHNRKADLQSRALRFRDAVRIAREKANSTPVTMKTNEGREVFSFIFQD